MAIAKTNVPGWKKNMKTGILINANENAVEQAQQARRAWREKKNLENRVNMLEERIQRLEYLLRK